MSELERLDARGLLCPLPVIRTQDAVKRLRPGTVLEVLSTDAGTIHDIPAWCRVHGHELLSIAESTEESTENSIEGSIGDRDHHTSWDGYVGGGHEIRIRLKVCR
jgi:tRNA 2-thiouridine synthesizing protein A